MTTTTPRIISTIEVGATWYADEQPYRWRTVAGLMRQAREWVAQGSGRIVRHPGRSAWQLIEEHTLDAHVPDPTRRTPLDDEPTTVRRGQYLTLRFRVELPSL